MVGPSGFVARVKGKEQTDTSYMGKGGVHEYVYATIDVSLASTTIPNNGLSVLKASSAAAVIKLDPPVPGIEKAIAVTSMSSASIAVLASSTGAVTFDGTNFVWKPSTVHGLTDSICLLGLTTSQWLNLGVAPSVTSTGTVPQGLQTTT